MAEGNQAVILAGGRGQRLRPYTDLAPKPMLLLGSRPILEYSITNLRKNGFSEIIIAAGYKHEAIEDYFGNGSEFGVKIEYSIEETPKDTGGALLEIKDKLKKHFVLGMADHITDINLRKMYDHHIRTKSMITIALEENRRRIGQIVVCGDETSDLSEGLCAPRVALAANMQANVAVELLLRERKST